MIDKAFKEKAAAWAAAQKEDLVRDLMDLVRVPSISQPDCTEPVFGQGCQDVLQLMLEKGQAMGYHATNYSGYAGSLSLTGEEKEHPEEVTGIWCHLDVVPVGDGWQSPPFEPKYEDGLIIGRGSQDNKSAAAMGLYLLKGLRELDIRLRRPVALYFGISEECGMQDLDGFLARYQAPRLSIIADCGFPACYGEKGDLGVRILAKADPSLTVTQLQAGSASNIIPGSASIEFSIGEKSFQLEASGQQGHSAFPEGSQNAIAVLLSQILEIPELDETDRRVLSLFKEMSVTTDGSPAGITFKDETYGDVTCCATYLRFHEGTWELDLDIRFPYTADPAGLVKGIAAYAEKSGCTAEQTSLLPAFGFPKDDPVIQTMTRVYNEEQGRNDQPFTMAGGTYAAKLPNAIPFGITFGDKTAMKKKFPPGHGDYHQPDECVEADMIVRALYLFLVTLPELDQL